MARANPKRASTTAKRPTPATIRIYPHPDMLARGDYLPGIGIAGADVEPELAEELVRTGLATTTRPAIAGQEG